MRLGHISLGDNAANGFHSRELKSVHIDSMARFVRLVVYKNHVNHHNLYNQVGIVAVNLLGDAEDQLALADGGLGLSAVETHQQYALMARAASGSRNPDLVVGSLVGSVANSGRVDCLPPAHPLSAGAGVRMRGPLGTGGPQIDPGTLGLINRARVALVDDIAFDALQDTESAALIRKLLAQKEQAVQAEDYGRAKELKNSIANLQQAGEELGRMERRKQQAVAAEDFDASSVDVFG